MPLPHPIPDAAFEAAPATTAIRAVLALIDPDDHDVAVRAVRAGPRTTTNKAYRDAFCSGTGGRAHRRALTAAQDAYAQRIAIKRAAGRGAKKNDPLARPLADRLADFRIARARRLIGAVLPTRHHHFARVDVRTVPDNGLDTELTDDHEEAFCLPANWYERIVGRGLLDVDARVTLVADEGHWYEQSACWVYKARWVRPASKYQVVLETGVLAVHCPRGRDEPYPRSLGYGVASYAGTSSLQRAIGSARRLIAPRRTQELHRVRKAAAAGPTATGTRAIPPFLALADHEAMRVSAENRLVSRLIPRVHQSAHVADRFFCFKKWVRVLLATAGTHADARRIGGGGGLRARALNAMPANAAFKLIDHDHFVHDRFWQSLIGMDVKQRSRHEWNDALWLGTAAEVIYGRGEYRPSSDQVNNALFRLLSDYTSSGQLGALRGTALRDALVVSAERVLSDDHGGKRVVAQRPIPASGAAPWDGRVRAIAA